jgi:hypothetical protein
VDQIKKHPFFLGVDWETIRRIHAPLVPQLRSITDTSYFPTDEIDQADEEAPTDSSAVGRDLAFLGSVDFCGLSFFLMLFAGIPSRDSELGPFLVIDGHKFGYLI